MPGPTTRAAPFSWRGTVNTSGTAAALFNALGKAKPAGTPGQLRRLAKIAGHVDGVTRAGTDTVAI